MVNVNNVQAMTTIIRELAYSKLKKELSYVGFVSVTVDQAAQFYGHGHGKQLCAARDVVVCKSAEGVEERTSIYVIDRDLGNVAYSSWIKSVLDQGTMCELLGQTTNEESLGDVVEMILGFFEVMSYFQRELPLWRDAWKIKRELEHSIVRRLAKNVSHTTGQNQKRNKSSAQLGAPAKEVLGIASSIKPRHPQSGSKRKATESEGDESQTRAEALSPMRRKAARDWWAKSCTQVPGLNGEVHGRNGNLCKVRKPGPRRRLQE